MEAELPVGAGGSTGLGEVLTSLLGSKQVGETTSLLWPVPFPEGR